MIETGKVVEIENDIARVELAGAKDKCSGCPVSSTCELVGEGTGGRRIIEVARGPEIRVGDQVKIEIKAGYFLKGFTLLFLVPAICFVVGALIGQVLMEGVLLSVILGIGFLVGTFFALHSVDRKLAEKNRPRIIQRV